MTPPPRSERLQRCCDALYEARSHFYPVDTYLVDLTLVASTTLGDTLRSELAGKLPTNLLVSGEVIEQMAQREPASLAVVRERLSNQTIGIIGGEFRETELPLLPVEEIIEQLEFGKRAYEQHLGVSPEIFGRRRFGLTPALPRILRSLDYKGALHFTLDDGRFAQADRSKTLWEGTGSTAIDAISRVPLDASDPASILSLPEKLGHSMDYDFVSILSFAHWPSVVSDYYDDLRRISNYSPVLGRFVTAADFFSNTESAGTFSKFSHDEYRSPYLVQAVRNGATDPLSAHVRAPTAAAERNGRCALRMGKFTRRQTSGRGERRFGCARCGPAGSRQRVSPTRAQSAHRRSPHQSLELPAPCGR